MKPTFRPYRSEDDFWRMREFLREVLLLNNCLQRSWHVARLDYARWHGLINIAKLRLEDVTFLWEDAGRLVAFMLSEGATGEIHFSVYPASRTLELEEEMLCVAEEHLADVSPERRKLCVFATESDHLRQDLFSRHGYVKADWPEHIWRRNLEMPIENVSIYPGYSIRSLGDGLELLERCYASGLGFHEGDINTAVENRTDVTWYRNIQTAPLYRRDLDLVAVASDGAIAAFCTIWFDDVTRSAYFEPVATVPAHQRRGIAKAVMTEGLRRLQHMGATTAFVTGYSTRANALYQSVMGPDHELYDPWEKEWTA